MSSSLRFFTLAVLTLCLSLTTGLASAGKDHNRIKNDADRVRALTAKTWWNNPQKVEKIGLNEEQRQRMDTLFMAYLEVHNAQLKAQKQSFKDFGHALSQNDTELSQRLRDEVTQSTAESVGKQMDMMVNVMAELSDEQRAIVTTDHPFLMSRLWVGAANPGAIKMGGREGKSRRGGGQGHSH